MRSSFSIILLCVAVAGCGDGRRSNRDGGPRPMPDAMVAEVDAQIECGELDLCGEQCVDLLNSSQHCGDCDRSCGGDQQCQSGECVTITTCTEPFTMCGESCVDTRSNRSHCGFCFEACPSAQTCVSGECRCSGTQTLCGESCVDTLSDEANCGFCENACTGTQTCTSGECVSTCASPRLVCGGVCTDVTNDARNCGSCGNICAAGSTCVSRVCTPPSGTGESCSSPEVVAATGGTRTFTFTANIANHTPFTCGATTARVDRAFRWTPSRSGTATISVAGPTITVDTMLAVFSTSSCTSTVSLGCNDDRVSGSSYDSTLSLAVTSGTTYYIVAAAYSDPPPTDTITLTVVSP